METTIKNVGKVYFKPYNGRERHYKVPRDFFEDFLGEFARVGAKYSGENNFFRYPVFGFKERQIGTLISPVLVRITDFYIQEAPASRNWKRKSKAYKINDTHGWIDYMCVYKNYVFLIEIKHGFISYNTEKIREYTNEAWVQIDKQLDSLKKYEASWYAEKCKGVFRLGLYIAPVFKSSRLENHEMNLDRYKLDNIILNAKELDPQPNLVGLWTTHENIHGPFDTLYGTTYYPAVLVLGNLKEVTVKK